MGPEVIVSCSVLRIYIIFVLPFQGPHPERCTGVTSGLMLGGGGTKSRTLTNVHLSFELFSQLFTFRVGGLERTHTRQFLSLTSGSVPRDQSCQSWGSGGICSNRN